MCVGNNNNVTDLYSQKKNDSAGKNTTNVRQCVCAFYTRFIVKNQIKT